MRKKISTQYYEEHMKILEDIKKTVPKLMKNKDLLNKWSETVEIETEKIVHNKLTRLLQMLGILKVEKTKRDYKLFTKANLEWLLECQMIEVTSIIRNDACEAKWRN